MVYALLGRGPDLEVPGRVSAFAQALVGAATGSMIQVSTLGELSDNWLAILVVCVLTLLASVGIGWLFARVCRLTRATGVFAMIAGGASGITAVARDLGADDRTVSLVQYLRVVLILFGMPVISLLAFDVGGGSGGPSVGTATGNGWLNLACTAVAVAGGLLIARFVRFPAVSLLAPMTVAIVLSLLGWLTAVPGWLQAVGFLVIGLQVGVRFTRASLGRILRLLPAALGFIALLIAGSAGFGVLLAAWTGHSMLDCYLATTPGGLYAVIATAIDGGADATFVLSVQLVRLVMMLGAAPLLARWLRPRDAG